MKIRTLIWYSVAKLFELFIQSTHVRGVCKCRIGNPPSVLMYSMRLSAHRLVYIYTVHNYVTMYEYTILHLIIAY